MIKNSLTGRVKVKQLREEMERLKPRLQKIPYWKIRFFERNPTLETPTNKNLLKNMYHLQSTNEEMLRLLTRFVENWERVHNETTQEP